MVLNPLEPVPRFPQKPHRDVETGGFEERTTVENAEPTGFPFAARAQQVEVFVVKLSQQWNKDGIVSFLCAEKLCEFPETRARGSSSQHPSFVEACSQSVDSF